jgi:hypothetical protein
VVHAPAALVLSGPLSPWGHHLRSTRCLDVQDANLRALSGRTYPRPDQAFLQRLIDYGIATGYQRGRSV